VGEDHFNIPESVACALEPLRRCEKIKQVILFGSRAVGDHDQRSDVDLAISGPGLSKGDVALLRDEIERAPSLFRIAVSHLEKMPATLRERVMEQGIVIHDREKALR
jgi:predicted nucleotidyltransferase